MPGPSWAKLQKHIQILNEIIIFQKYELIYISSKNTSYSLFVWAEVPPSLSTAQDQLQSCKWP